MVGRTFREFSQEEIDLIAATYHAWRGESGDVEYEDLPGFCNAAPVEKVREHDYVLTPGRYVGAAEEEGDGEPFGEKMNRLVGQLHEQFDESDRLKEQIKNKLEGVGYE